MCRSFSTRMTRPPSANGSRSVVHFTRDANRSPLPIPSLFSGFSSRTPRIINRPKESKPSISFSQMIDASKSSRTSSQVGERAEVLADISFDWAAAVVLIKNLNRPHGWQAENDGCPPCVDRQTSRCRQKESICPTQWSVHLKLAQRENKIHHWWGNDSLFASMDWENDLPVASSLTHLWHEMSPAGRQTPSYFELVQGRSLPLPAVTRLSP